jgi:inorganic pyrophosphatase
MGMHCRDVIDVVMLNLSKLEISEAITKTKVAYGEAILKDLFKVIVCLFITNDLAAQSIINYGSLASFSENGYLQVVVEIPAGTNKKLEYDYVTNTFPADIKDGQERIINFLPYPGNYGFISSTMMDRARGGDGDAVDVLVLSQHSPTGTILEVIPIALVNLMDNGEIDSKIIAVPINASQQVISATSYSQLHSKYPNVQRVIELWFTSYKGPGIMELGDWGDERRAKAEIEKWFMIN